MTEFPFESPSRKGYGAVYPFRDTKARTMQSALAAAFADPTGEKAAALLAARIKERAEAVADALSRAYEAQRDSTARGTKE